MDDDQLSTLWAFSRGDLPGDAFEKWCFIQSGLAEGLGEDLHWNLVSANYSDREQVWELRRSLAGRLAPLKQCECPIIRDRAAISMGGNFYSDKVFESLDRQMDYGPEKWWLYIDRCRCCSTVWLIAQDDRIYDDFFFARIDEGALLNAKMGEWPSLFVTYEDVLASGRKLSYPPRFFDPMASSLQCSVEDLLRERPAISTEEIAYLLGLSSDDAKNLIRKVQTSRS